jgi:flagellar M-ring protein FliF
VATDPKAAFGQVVRFVTELPRGRRLALAGALAVGMAAFGAIVLWQGGGDWQVLFSNLAPDDAARIAGRLKEQRVPFRVASAGEVIEVPSAHVHEVRLALAGEGLPRGGGVGFEIFDQQSFGLSEFAQQLNYRRALEGELQRTINRLDVVASARVHLALPERRLLREREGKATASVTLKLQPGRRLGGEQVAAIVHLIAASVEALTPEDVTVVDTAGEVLSRGGGDVNARMGATIELQRTIEAQLEDRVRQTLEHAVGAGRVAVQVAATVNFAASEKTEEAYDPDRQVIRNEQTTVEKTVSGGTTASGVPGDAPSLAGVGRADNAASSERQSATKSYEISKVTSRVVEPVGQVERLSVAVLIDDARAPEAGGKAGAAGPRTRDELARLDAIVKRAVGFDAARGDQVEVQSVRFAGAEEAAPAPPAPVLRRLAERHAPQALAALGLFAVAAAVLVAVRGAASRTSIEVVELPRTVRDLEASVGAHGLPSGTLPRVLAVNNDDGERAAEVLRAWLGDRPRS